MKLNLPLDIEKVKGFLDPLEGEALYTHSKTATEGGPALEIGSYCGKSAVYIGLAAKENDEKLYSVDHHKGSEEQQPGEEYYDPDLIDKTRKGIDTLPFFLDTIRKSDLEGVVIPVVSTSFVTSTGTAWDNMAALGTAAIIPAFIFILLVQRHLVRGLTLGSVKQ